MRGRVLALLLAAVLPVWTTSAQVMVPTMDPFAGSDEGDTVRPITSYPLGQSELVARDMVTALRLEQKQRDLCWELGCVVFVNESKTYMVTGFYVQTAAADGTMSWSRNQFGAPLLAKRATVRFKTGPQSACDLPARFVLRAPHRKQSISYDTRISLCSSPHQHSLIRIRAAIPEVEVGS